MKCKRNHLKGTQHDWRNCRPKKKKKKRKKERKKKTWRGWMFGVTCGDKGGPCPSQGGVTATTHARHGMASWNIWPADSFACRNEGGNGYKASLLFFFFCPPLMFGWPCTSIHNNHHRHPLSLPVLFSLATRLKTPHVVGLYKIEMNDLESIKDGWWVFESKTHVCRHRDAPSWPIASVPQEHPHVYMIIQLFCVVDTVK